MDKIKLYVDQLNLENVTKTTFMNDFLLLCFIHPAYNADYILEVYFLFYDCIIFLAPLKYQDLI